jgi:fido (protein-threonine AMPylation protein)
MGRKFKADHILTEDFVKLVHKKMSGDVWAWAGEFRKTNKNIGVDRNLIQ